MSKHIRRLLAVVAGLCFLQPAMAGDPNYNTQLIPAALTKNVHAVKRFEEINVVVNGPDDIRITRHYVITVLDREGEKYARFYSSYDKLREIRSIHGVLYDAAGKQLKRVKQSDIGDYSHSDGFSLASDARYKSHSFEYSSYPYTIEYEEEKKERSTYFLPGWVPQSSEAFSVEQSKLIVNLPEKDTLRYRSFHYRGDPAVTTDKGIRTYTWEVSNIGAAPEEDYAPEWYTRTTSVILAPGNFNLQDYNGNMNTWAQLGHFFYILNKGRDQLPDNIKQVVHQLTDGLPREEKITKLYKYMQEHTRYISIQLGIGGLQTFDATYVADKGYGDCKALSNYMCALLKEAGIKANCVLVHAGEGENDFVEDFPSDQFDHVITCVPGDKDTTWLECTNSTIPAGYLGGFTCNRPALITGETEADSKLVHTPVYSIEQNLLIRHAEATVTTDGDMQVQAITRYTGLQQDQLHAMVRALTKEKILDAIKEEGLMPSYDVNSYSWQEYPARLPAFEEQLALTAHGYATVTGKRIFIEPNLLSKSSRRFQTDSARKADISLRTCFRDIDTVKITMPVGYTPESMPLPVSIECPFGAYNARVSMVDTTLLYVRTMERKQGDFPAADFPKLEAFYNAIYKADRAKVVLVKK